MKRALSNIYYSCFSEVGYITKQLNFALNYAFNYKRIAKDTIASKNVIEVLSKTRAPDVKKLDNILTQLKEYGYCRINVEDFPSIREPLGKLKDFLIDIANSKIPTEAEFNLANKVASKKYWLDLYKRNYEYNKEADPVHVLVGNPIIIYLSCKYLGQLPLLTELSFYYSPPRLRDQEHYIGSQNWHRDNEKPYQLKLFYSPFSVDESSGPTTFIPHYYTRGLSYPNYPGYFTDQEAMQAGFPLEKRIQMKSNPREIYLVDTSRCYHLGSRNSSASRFLLIAGLGPYYSYLNPFKMRRLYSESMGFPLFNKYFRYRATL